MSDRQAEPLLRRKDDLHVANWNVRTLQDVAVYALIMRELRKYSARLLEIRIPDDGDSVINVPGEETCYHLYHSRVVEIATRYGVSIAASEAVQTALLAWAPISSHLASARDPFTFGLFVKRRWLLSTSILAINVLVISFHYFVNSSDNFLLKPHVESLIGDHI